MEVGSFVGGLVQGNEKVDVEDVWDRLEGGFESDVTAMARLVIRCSRHSQTSL